jgi:hypothetical protein
MLLLMKNEQSKHCQKQLRYLYSAETYMCGTLAAQLHVWLFVLFLRKKYSPNFSCCIMLMELKSYKSKSTPKHTTPNIIEASSST